MSFFSTILNLFRRRKPTEEVGHKKSIDRDEHQTKSIGSTSNSISSTTSSFIMVAKEEENPRMLSNSVTDEQQSTTRDSHVSTEQDLKLDTQMTHTAVTTGEDTKSTPSKETQPALTEDKSDSEAEEKRQLEARLHLGGTAEKAQIRSKYQFEPDTDDEDEDEEALEALEPSEIEKRLRAFGVMSAAISDDLARHGCIQGCLHQVNMANTGDEGIQVTRQRLDRIR